MRSIASLGWARLALTRSRQCRHVQASLSTTSSLRFPPTHGHQQLWYRFVHHQVQDTRARFPSIADKVGRRPLPLQCPGCGAFSQTTTPGEAGYFDLNRGAVKEYVAAPEPNAASTVGSQEDQVIQETLGRLPAETLEELGLDANGLLPSNDSAHFDAEKATPRCDRCHALVHHSQGAPIYHPSVHSIRDIIEESPHKYSHVYHLVDAADFPMSLVPRLHQLIGEIYLRTQNRRARSHGRFYRNRLVDMSFVITRADLLAPTKAQVDSLLPYFRDVLRQALGRVGRRIRLGNVHLVSANRGWWTRSLKEEIYQRGGAAWMVGKANVGKSTLFEAVFPKGRLDTGPLPKSPTSSNLRVAAGDVSDARDAGEASSAGDSWAETGTRESSMLDVGEMLPPLRPELAYPDMPTVSSLPGTTASPIRIPFGRGKGELIDLPGLERSHLDQHVREGQRNSLVMKSRIAPDQKIIKPGQSLLLGGFIRITPKTPDLVFLTANFTPLTDHITSTEKAISVQGQEGTVAVENISVPGTNALVKLAGTFELAHDVTRQRAGPLTRKNAIGLKPDRLPFRVLAFDLLIEGVGWVEISTQVRTKNYPYERRPRALDAFDRLDAAASGGDEEAAHRPALPEVEVFTPEGRFVACRPPMNGYVLNKRRRDKSAPPRRSMKGQKKRAKMLRRQQEAAKLS